MIRAVYESAVPRLTVRGHAAYAPRGQDIVCAAASALLYALAGSLQQSGGDVPDVSVAPGFVKITGGPEDTASFALTVGGLRQLAMRYPAHVAVMIEGS